jgi:hypothetical protein
VADYAIEGGRFLQACETLVTEDFRISWLDRFPSPRQVLSASTLSSLDLPASVGGGAPPMQELVEASVRTQAESGQAVLVMQPRAQTRARYVCPCGVKVWGKPNIKIWCGNCNGSFEVGT